MRPNTQWIKSFHPLAMKNGIKQTKRLVIDRREELMDTFPSILNRVDDSCKMAKLLTRGLSP